MFHINDTAPFNFVLLCNSGVHEQYIYTQDVLQSCRWPFKGSFTCPGKQGERFQYHSDVLGFCTRPSVSKVWRKSDLYLPSFHNSSVMQSAYKVLVMAPLDRGTVIVLETLKILVPAVLSQWPENCKRNHCNTNMSMASIDVAHFLGNKCMPHYIGWWLPLLSNFATLQQAQYLSLQPQPRRWLHCSIKSIQISTVTAPWTPVQFVMPGGDCLHLIKSVLLNYQKGAWTLLAVPRASHLHLYWILPQYLQISNIDHNSTADYSSTVSFHIFGKRSVPPHPVSSSLLSLLALNHLLQEQRYSAKSDHMAASTKRSRPGWTGP